MKRFFENIAIFIGAIFAMCTEEQTRQYNYDNGEGEI